MTKKNEKKIEDSEIDNLKQKLEDAENNYKRALADYQNLQKRVLEERKDLILAANRDLLLRILSVLDTLKLANQHVENEGLKVSINQFEDTLKSEGVSKIETKDAEFDPNLMECVVTDQGQENKVLDELRAGYVLNDKVLRPAQVKVGKE